MRLIFRTSDIEDGLICEMDFRKHYFDSIEKWPDDENMLVARYEDIIGNVQHIFQ
jgi:hypothetical protein